MGTYFNDWYLIAAFCSTIFITFVFLKFLLKKSVIAKINKSIFRKVFLLIFAPLLSLLLIYNIMDFIVVNPGNPTIKKISNNESKKLLILFHGWTGSMESLIQASSVLNNKTNYPDFEIYTISYPTYFSRNNPDYKILSKDVLQILRNTSPNKEFYFLAHSAGGLLARLVILNNSLTDQPIDIKRLISLGSPYGGANVATLSELLKTPNKLIRDLRPGSKFLMLIGENWNGFLSSSTSQGFSEHCLASSTDAVVNVESAQFKCMVKTTIQNRSHRSLIRFADSDDEVYEFVLTALQFN